VRFALLGPLQITSDDDHAVEIRGAKARTLAAAMLCRANRPIPPAALAQALWGDAPPRQAAASLRVYLHHLRQALGEARIERTTDGYQLRVLPEELDVDRFHRLVEAGRAARASGDAAGASAAFAEALHLWRGPALDGFDDVPALRAEAERLEAVRLDAAEGRFEAELSLGHAASVVRDLRRLADEHPLRETFRVQLVRALLAAHRTAEAVAVCEETKKRYQSEFGVEPGPRLRELHAGLLSERAAPGAPRQLPADLTAFTGRADELHHLDERLDADDRVVTISGMGGIGKTALALHWAHRVADRFPDGQLYVNLHGFDPARAPMDPGVALGLFLGALGVPPARIPVERAAQEATYRGLLAGRRVLIVLDNAHDADQIAPLLPHREDLRARPDAGCFTVVTSRHVLTAGHALALGLLSPTEAHELLRSRLDPARLAAEPSAVAAILARCAGLALPLSIVASRAMVMARFPLSALADELRSVRHALDGFSSDDPAADLRAVFSWSYEVLSEPTARLFRLLALHPGPDATVRSAASLAGVPLPAAERALGELLAANLIGSAGPGRYAYHDLLRGYAMELAEAHDAPEERRAAVHRVLDHYSQTANSAAKLLDPRNEPAAIDPPGPGVVPEVLADNAAALAWFTAERAVLVAAVARAAESGFDALTWQIAWTFVVFLNRHGDWHDRITVQRTALAAARRDGNRPVEASLLRGLARAFGRMRQFDEAFPYVHAARAVYRSLGDRGGEARVLGTQAELLEFQGNYRAALNLVNEANPLYREALNTVGEAQMLNHMGYLHALLGEHEQALAPTQRAVELFVSVGDSAGEAAASDSVGFALHNLGRPAEAVERYERALQLLTANGDRYFIAVVNDHLADALAALGENQRARATWEAALADFELLEVPEAAQVRQKLSRDQRAGPAPVRKR
jgi:DNA-binding SARP family transcriptional activator/tetratricopeptide (TPR) repeat protein